MEISDSRPGNSPTGSAEKDSTLAVKVALNIRPLITWERVQGCKDCITVVRGEPQVHIGSHSFTFDHVYGSTGSSLSVIFEECVAPVVDGLFQGFNATVLAYGQTGSGKTYTMGTGYTVGASRDGIIPKVMETLFAKIDVLKSSSDFKIRVSFIEILKEEVHDLLDPSPSPTFRTELSNGGGFADSKYSGKPTAVGKPPIQIRETTNGGITLVGVTETDVTSLGEMALCLEQGSLCRATGSTMMNTSSSRSHAIFTITLEQRRKWEAIPIDTTPPLDDTNGDTEEDYLCGKFHLVDLAGSERAKRTQADGVRFKEGVHINKGLLALGNVISALGDEKKRREGGHVPYRDSKLTRLLQDSLGGNSRTVMIACVSPADSNVEETLNTLKYANRARNIQNKPTVNRDPVAAEMSRMRQRLELMQAELQCARAGCVPDEVQLYKQKIAWLETCNMDLRQQLQQARALLQEFTLNYQDELRLKLDKVRGGQHIADEDDEDNSQSDDLYHKRIQDLEGELQKFQCSGAASEAELPVDSDSVAVVEDQAKEWEYNMLQENLDKELQELNKHLELKEAEMKTFIRSDPAVLKQHFERKLVELEDEKKDLQRERDMLVTELEKLTITSDEQSQKLQESYLHKLKGLETLIADLKKKQENQSQHLRAKQRADEMAKRLHDDILRLKNQKVHLQQKIKQESEQFRAWKASREKELLQLRKEGRRNEYEMHKLQALHQRQKMVLQRKTEEAAVATRRLKELLEARRSPRDSPAHGNSGHDQYNEKNLQQWLDQEVEMAVRVHEVRSAYEKQMEERLVLAKELAILQEGEDLLKSSVDPTPSMSPCARSARVLLLESLLNTSSSGLVTMASQLSEAEERERSFGGRARWQHLRSMADAKSLLQFAFDASALSKCRVRDVEEESKEVKERLSELEEVLRQSEVCRQELERQQQRRNHPGVSSLTTISMTGAEVGMMIIGDALLKSGETALEGPLDHVSSKRNMIPYVLREAWRDQTSTKYEEKIDSYEGELDMDTESDEEWNENFERQAVKRNRAHGSITVSNSLLKSMSIDKTLSNGSPLGLRKPERVSLGLQPSPGENVLVDNEDKRKERLNPCSCSCTQSSGCKTKKCECKAAGGLCGTQCGCTSSRCNNHEAENEAESFSLANSIKVEVARQAVAPLGVDRTLRRFHEENEANSILKGIESPIHIVTEDEHVTKRVERLLAIHGASLLESAWQEGFRSTGMKEDEEERQTGQDVVQDTAASRRPERRALHDIGNKLSARRKSFGKQRKRQTSIIQLVSMGPSAYNGLSIPAPLPSTADGGNAPTIAPPNVTLATISDIPSLSWRDHDLQRNSSGQLSPLRQRDNKAGVSLSSVGRRPDLQGGSKNIKKKPESPTGPEHGTDGKENIQRNSFV